MMVMGGGEERGEERGPILGKERERSSPQNPLLGVTASRAALPYTRRPAYAGDVPHHEYGMVWYGGIEDIRAGGRGEERSQTV